MADAPAGTYSGLALHDLREQFIGMEAALHQQLGFARPHQLDRFLGGGLTMRHVDDLDAPRSSEKLWATC